MATSNNGAPAGASNVVRFPVTPVMDLRRQANVCRSDRMLNHWRERAIKEVTKGRISPYEYDLLLGWACLCMEARRAAR